MRKIKDILIVALILVLVIATAVLAGIEISNIGTISGLTLVPFLIGLVWFGVDMIRKDIKEFKELYEMADDE